MLKKIAKSIRLSSKESIDAIKQFSEIGLDLPTAQKILTKLYAAGLGVSELEWAISKLKFMLQEQAVLKMLQGAKDSDIEEVVGEIMEKKNESDGMQESQKPFSEGGYFLFSELVFGEKKLEAGNKVEIQIMRVGKWKHQEYGEIIVDEKTLDNVIKNFQEHARGIDLAVDENHEPNHKALAWFREVYKKGKNALFATLELTARGAQLLNEGAYKYFSPEISFQKRDEESGKVFKDLLVGGAFTNRPFFKAMQPLMASEAATQRKSKDVSEFAPVLFHNLNNTMKAKKLLEKVGNVAASEKLTERDMAELNFLFGELDAETKQDVQLVVTEVYQRYSEENSGADGTAIKPVAPAGEAANPEDAAKAEAAAAEAKAKADAEAAEVEAKAKADAEAAEAKAKEEEDATKKPLEANEKGEVTVKLAELEAREKKFKEVQVENAKMLKEIRTSKVAERVKGLTFSETTKKGAILPKDAQEVIEFAVSLSEPAAEKFFAVLEKQSKSLDLVREFGEAGVSETSVAENAAFKEAVAEAMKLGNDKETSEAIAKEFVESKKKKGEL